MAHEKGREEEEEDVLVAALGAYLTLLATSDKEFRATKTTFGQRHKLERIRPFSSPEPSQLRSQKREITDGRLERESDRADIELCKI